MSRRLRLLAAIPAIAVAAAATTAAANAHADAGGGPSLKAVKAATAKYHSAQAAERDGYELFLDCFSSDDGGMGQHYVHLAALDADVDALAPEAMVYDTSSGSPKLVAVEWIVPDSPAVAADPPALFGHTFHLNTALDVWVLHAWIWQHNPAGTFSDWNPDVPGCPNAH